MAVTVATKGFGTFLTLFDVVGKEKGQGKGGSRGTFYLVHRDPSLPFPKPSPFPVLPLIKHNKKHPTTMTPFENSTVQ